MYPNEAKETERAKDIPTELRALEEAVKVLESSCSILEDKLSPILSPSTADKLSQGPSPHEIKVPLADEIRSKRYAVERASSALNGIAYRLQI